MSTTSRLLALACLLVVTACQADRNPTVGEPVTVTITVDRGKLRALAERQGGVPPLIQEGRGVTFETTDVWLTGRSGSVRWRQDLGWGENTFVWHIPADGVVNVTLHSRGGLRVRAELGPVSAASAVLTLPQPSAPAAAE